MTIITAAEARELSNTTTPLVGTMNGNYRHSQHKRSTMNHPLHVLLTGATGFLGQAILERLLQDNPHDHITVIIRGETEEAAKKRLDSLYDKPVFDQWKARIGEEEAKSQWEKRVHLLNGDLADKLALPKNLTHVVHSASSVKFDEQLPIAVSSNVKGPLNLYQSLADVDYSGPVVHVSTAYVQANRTKRAAECSVAHSHDWKQVVKHAETSTDAIERTAVRKGKTTRWTEEQHVIQGKRLSKRLGFTDIYTTTKALGERVAENHWGDRQLTIVRPTIIESAHQFPYPGWIDGFKVAEPLIAAYAKGRITEFPGSHDAVMDIVPVDQVVTAIMVALKHPPTEGDTRYLQVGTSTTNPLPMGHLRDIVQAFYHENPLTDAKGNAPVTDWRFRNAYMMITQVGIQHATIKAMRRVHSAMPKKSRNTSVRLAKHDRGLRSLSKFLSLYAPYTSSPTVYESSSTTRLLKEAGVSSPNLEWRTYFTNVHLPSVNAMIR